MDEDNMIPGWCPPKLTETLKVMQAKYDSDSFRDRLDLIEQYHITDYDEEVCIKLSDVRRPLVLVRGRSISREQAMQLIVGKSLCSVKALTMSVPGSTQEVIAAY